MTDRNSRPAALPTLRVTRALALLLALPVALATQSQAAVVISQVYGGGGNSGATLKNDFIELFNNGTAAVPVGGWSVQYNSAAGTGNWQVTPLPANTTIQPGQYLLIYEAPGTAGASPLTPDVTGTIAMAAAAGRVALVNNGAALPGGTNSGGAIVDAVSYGPSTVQTEGTPTAQLSNTTAALRNSGGCIDTNNNSADFSIGTPMPRSSAATLAPCDGSVGGGGSGSPPKSAAIFTIQGSGASSPLLGQTVLTSGVVTKVVNNGFFIQDPVGDGKPETSDGIFVFTSTAPPAAAAVGNLVQVTGSVVEFSSGAGTAATPLTEINNVTAVSVLNSGLTITPTVVTLPLAEGDTLERYEGMLVRFTGTLTVQQNYFQARFGQLTIGAGGRHETPTNRYRPGTAQAVALADLEARSRLLLDDGSSLQNANPTAYALPGGVPRAGDQVSNLVGVLDYGLATATASGAGLYRLQPTEAPVFAVANARTTTPPTVVGNIKLASMNVLNFFTTFTDGTTATGQTAQGCTLGSATSASNCRGADSLIEFQRQRAKIVVALAGMNADAVGLMEMQNNGNVAVQNLVDALNAQVGAGTYAVVPAPSQGTGTDAIRVAMIYKPAKLNLIGASNSDADAINNRPPLAQTFAAANGEKFTLIVNHLKSKSSCPAVGDANYAGNNDIGDGQGCWNAQRVAQARRLRTFVAQVQSTSGSNDVLLVGDFNAYAQEDPVYDLTSSGYIDQSGRFEQLGYSYVFDGTAGRLDHAITTASLSSKVMGAVHWHIDADEGLAQDYNLEFKQPACATCAPDPYDGTLPFRASDHDPVLVGLGLFKTFVGTSGRDAIVGSNGDDIIIGGAGADTLTGGGGVNVFVYTSPLDAGDTITDFVPGKDFLDLRTILQGYGYTGSDPVADGYVRFSPVAAGTGVQIGPNASNYRIFLTLKGIGPGSIDPKRDLIVQ